jgi:hypothetical protein
MLLLWAANCSRKFLIQEVRCTCPVLYTRMVTAKLIQMLCTLTCTCEATYNQVPGARTTMTATYNQVPGARTTMTPGCAPVVVNEKKTQIFTIEHTPHNHTPHSTQLDCSTRVTVRTIYHTNHRRACDHSCHLGPAPAVLNHSWWSCVTPPCKQVLSIAVPW